MAAQGVIQSGARWRVGVENHVKKWQDPWLPDMTLQENWDMVALF